jgi:hypothetical protein
MRQTNMFGPQRRVEVTGTSTESAKLTRGRDLAKSGLYLASRQKSVSNAIAKIIRSGARIMLR